MIGIRVGKLELKTAQLGDAGWSQHFQKTFFFKKEKATF